MKYLLRLGKAQAILIVAILIFISAVAPVQTAKGAASVRCESAVSISENSQAAESNSGFDGSKVSGLDLIRLIQAKRISVDLSAITLSSWATLEPAFSPGKTKYNIALPYYRSYLRILPQVTDSSARCSLTVDGKKTTSDIRVDMGQSKTVLITVSAQNGIINKTYTLNINRAYPSDQIQASFENLIPTAQMSFEELIDDDETRDLPPDPATLPSPDTYLLEIDLVNQYVAAYKKDADGAYTVPCRFMICSSGKRSTPTPVGTFKLNGLKKRFGYFYKFDVYAQYWTKIVGGIYFHSIIYGRRSDQYLSEGSYKNLGTAVSHGCIRLLPPDAKWIYENCAPGTTVVITKSKARDMILPALLRPPPIP